VHATSVGGVHPALIEAMSHARAIACSDTRENRETLGEAGLYYSVGSAEECAGAIRRLASDAELRAETDLFRKRLAEGETVVTRWTATGTNEGELMGMPPTGKQATTAGININRVSGGKLVEGWGLFDQLGLLQQIGAVPVPTRV